MLQGAMKKYAGGKEVVVSGSNNSKTKEFIHLYQGSYHPFDILMIANRKELKIEELNVWKDKIDSQYEFILYICEQYACKNPIFTIEEAIQSMNL